MPIVETLRVCRGAPTWPYRMRPDRALEATTEDAAWCESCHWRPSV
jgi:hypothetical protein